MNNKKRWIILGVVTAVIVVATLIYAFLTTDTTYRKVSSIECKDDKFCLILDDNKSLNLTNNDNKPHFKTIVKDVDGELFDSDFISLTTDVSNYSIEVKTKFPRKLYYRIVTDSEALWKDPEPN